MKIRALTIKRRSRNYKTLMLCGAAEAGNSEAKRNLRSLVAGQPFAKRILKEFLSSEDLQAKFKHTKCPRCPLVLSVDNLEAHLLRCNTQTSTRDKKKTKKKKSDPASAKAEPVKKRLKIKRSWVEIHSNRSTRLSDSQLRCGRCQTKRGQLWEYADTSIGLLILCEKCKRLAAKGGKNKRKRRKKVGGDAMSRTWTGGGFETNRQRH